MSSHVALQAPKSHAFWGEIAPSEHVAQFYENDGVFLDTLTQFVGGGLNAGESTIVIATPQHLQSLEQRLLQSGVDLVAAILEDRFIALDAETALARFMVGPLPDDELFGDLVNRLILRASVRNRRMRAFGEMVALLWARGNIAATVRLEHLWQQICLSRSFSLFCAYPKSGFARTPESFLEQICTAHTRVI